MLYRPSFFESYVELILIVFKKSQASSMYLRFKITLITFSLYLQCKRNIFSTKVYYI